MTQTWELWIGHERATVSDAEIPADNILLLSCLVRPDFPFYLPHGLATGDFEIIMSLHIQPVSRGKSEVTR